MANRPFVTDAILTAVAVGYQNPALTRIADMVMPRKPVGDETFKWMEYPTKEAFQLPDARVGRKGKVTQLEFTGTERESSVEDFGLDSPIPNTDIEAARNARARKVSPFDPETHAVKMLKDIILNIREVRVANFTFDPNNYDVARREALTGTDVWDDYANSDPIQAIKDGMNSTLIYRPNTAVFSRRVWSILSSHPKIVNAVKGNLTNSGIVTPEQFAAIFAGEGLKKVLIGDAYFDTANIGQDINLQQAWGDHMALLHINETAIPQGGVITWGMTAQYGGDVAGRIETPDVGLQGGQIVRYGERVKELIIAKETGFLFQNVLGG